MDSLDAIILGVVEGLTEFLPISSTGHLVLVSHLLGLSETDFLKSFEVVIQLGAILAVVTLYWRKLLFDRAVMQRIVVALLPALGVGYLFYATIRSLLVSQLTVVIALFVGGVILILFERYRQEPTNPAAVETLTYKQALLIGLAQALSVVPGVSRAGATIVGGLATGLSRSAAVEFSFLLGVPTMVAATTLDVVKHHADFSLADIQSLAIGLIVSFLVALVAIKFLLRYVETHSFVAFGVYRILVAVLFTLIIL
ncbi:MAG: undecaprenyl-diphosphate phosphatase [Candidatus Moraniibacteriota bacterium]|nr:MAG: undecaprenyl-diphosphate phosphatase [Candidatus Moranbacteria bacterium]